MRTLRRSTVTLLALAVWALNAPPAGAAGAGDFVVEVVALSGQQAPGMESGALFFDPGPSPGVASRIDREGTVALNAFVTGPGISPSANGQGLWKTSAGALELVARQGDPAPDTESGTLFHRLDNFFGPVPPTVVGGHLAFTANLSGPAVEAGRSHGVWSDRLGVLRKVVRTGDPAPGLLDGSVFNDFNYTLSRTGHVAINGAFGLFNESPAVDRNREGLWSDRAGALALVARGGGAAPGTTTGVVFGEGAFFAVGGAFRDWTFGGDSRLAFHGNLAGAVIDDLNDEGIWVETPQGPRLVAREGDPAPGFGPGVHYGALTGIDGFSAPTPMTMGRSGALLFEATVSGPGVPFASVLYTTRGSGAAHVLAEGGVLQATIDEFDRVAFLGFVGPGPLGIWSDRTGTLVQIAAVGMQAADLPAGIVYGNPDANNNPFLLGGLGGGGHVGFASRLSGPGVDASNGAAIFLSDPEGTTRLVVRANDLFDLFQDGSDLRRVRDARMAGVSTRGELGLTLFFDDGSRGVFTFCDPACQAGPALPPLPPPTPAPPTTIFLEAIGRTVKGRNFVDLAWRGAYDSTVALLRDGVAIASTANDGRHTDALSKAQRRGTFVYRVCETTTATCSATAAITF